MTRRRLRAVGIASSSLTTTMASQSVAFVVPDVDVSMSEVAG